MGLDGELYKLVLLVHILAVVVGFGSVMLNGVYGNLARRKGGAEGVAISQANLVVTSTWAEKVIWAVPVLGIALILLSDDAWGFDQAWISLSFLLYIVGVAVARLVLIPSHRRLNELAMAKPPPVAELEAQGKRLAAAGMALNLLVVVLIALMIWKPGV